MKRSALCLGLMAALTFASPVFAIGSNFSYQGSLQDAGVAANGSYDLEFRLQTQAGVPVGSTVVKEDVAVAQGVFSVVLDFGPVISTADYQLVIGVRAGASVGAFTALAPATKITATPQAQVATIAAEAVTVSPGSVTSAGIADGSIGSADINSAQVQRRVASTCAAGQAIRNIAADGTVTCETGPTGPTGPAGPAGPAGPQGLQGAMGAGDITAVTTAEFGGLAGGLDSGAPDLSIRPDGIAGYMIQNGAVGATDVNSAQVQLRITAGCPVGQFIQSVAANGAPVCAYPSLSSTSVPIPQAVAQLTAADNCQVQGSSEAVEIPGPIVQVPAGTYLATVPINAGVIADHGIVNGVQVSGIATVTTSLELSGSPTTIFARSATSLFATLASTSSYPYSTTTLFTLGQPTDLRVRTSVRIAGCGTAAGYAGSVILLRVR